MPNRPEEHVITPALLRSWPLPDPQGGKKARGTVLVVGGSRFTPGAVLLAGVAALRAGAGVLQLAVDGDTAAALSIAVPEAKVVSLPAKGAALPGELRELAEQADVLTIGPGERTAPHPPARPHRVPGPRARRRGGRDHRDGLSPTSRG